MKSDEKSNNCESCGGVVETKEIVLKKTSEGEPLKLKYVTKCMSCGKVYGGSDIIEP